MGSGERSFVRRSVQLVAAALMLTMAVGCSGNPSSRAPDSAPYAAPASLKGGLPEAPVPPGAPVTDTAPKADIVTTGTLRMTVASPTEVADKFVAATTEAGGRVESRSEQSANTSPTVELTLRIPSDKVDGVLAKIDEFGVVDSMQISRDEVTAQRVDLEARIKALETSVTRLLDLMSKSASTSALLEAESSLTERQAELDSLKSQRAQLGDQIAYATIMVTLATQPEVIAPGGFWGAVKNGWHALVNFGGGLAAVIGFLLPWTPVVAAIVGALWFLRRRWRRNHPKSKGPAAPTPPPAWMPNPSTPVAPETPADPS